jgi:hypothetical protein
VPDLRAALATLGRAPAGRLALYRELVPRIERLAADVAA